MPAALKIWVFSGDVDGIVPVLGSRRWIESLQLPVVKPWRSWTSTTGQVGACLLVYRFHAWLLSVQLAWMDIQVCSPCPPANRCDEPSLLWSGGGSFAGVGPCKQEHQPAPALTSLLCLPWTCGLSFGPQVLAVCGKRLPSSLPPAETVPVFATAIS